MKRHMNVLHSLSSTQEHSVSLINVPVLFSDAPFIKVHTQHIVEIVINL